MLIVVSSRIFAISFISLVYFKFLLAISSIMHASELLDAGMEPTWAHERRFQLHRKKLQQIRGRSIAPATQPASTNRTSLPRLKALSYLEAERQEAIKRENALLMQKLVTIAEGKKQHKARRSLEPRSLNEYLRKKEEDRIKAENEAFSRRITEKEGEISKRKLDLSFFDSERYKRQISKTHILKSQLRAVRLNPLTDSDSEAKGNSSGREQRTKRSPKAYQRPNELSPLNRTMPAIEPGKLQDRTMDTKGEVAVIVDGKKAKKRAKGLNETTEARAQGKSLQTSVLTQTLTKRKSEKVPNSTINQAEISGDSYKTVPFIAPKSTTKITPTKSPMTEGKEEKKESEQAVKTTENQPIEPIEKQEIQRVSPKPPSEKPNIVSPVPLAEDQEEPVKEDVPSPKVETPLNEANTTVLKASSPEPQLTTALPNTVEAAEPPKSIDVQDDAPLIAPVEPTSDNIEVPLPVPEAQTEVAALPPSADDQKPEPLKEAPQSPTEAQPSS